MSEFTVKKSGRKIVMSINIRKELREDVLEAAEKGGVSVSSFVEQALEFVLSEKKESKK